MKAIRWHPDQGLVPPAGRSAAGYRLYDMEALARLELVRTLRRLDIDLRTIERVPTREMGPVEAAGAPTAHSPDFRTRLLATPESGTDRRAERYWQLLAVVNGWPPIPSVVPAFE